VLEECGHEVVVANARKLRLIYANKHKTDEVDAENLARLARPFLDGEGVTVPPKS
jgi:transposase